MVIVAERAHNGKADHRDCNYRPGAMLMRAFEVYRNGKRLCVAGIGENGVLTTIIGHLCKASRFDDYLQVGGLDSSTREHVTWMSHAKLRVGDEIRVRLIDIKSVDRPRERHRVDTPESMKGRKLYVRRMAKELGWKITTRRTKSK